MKTQLVQDPVTLLWKVISGTPLEQAVIAFIHTSWGTRDYFPGPQPISIERSHFPLLKKNKYVVCEKSDGVRHLLVSFMFGDKKICVLVNRMFTITLVPLNLPKVAYQGTILDGELVDTTFLIYDAVVVSGTNVKDFNLIERLQSAEKILMGVMRVKTNPVSLKMKTFCSLKEYDYNTVVSGTDGLIFTPVHESIKTGTHETMFKWKPRDKNTIDFQFKRWDPQNKWGMYVLEKGRLVFESELLYIKSPDWITDEDCIVECQYMCDEEPRWWKPICIRNDKTHPNNRRTFYRTLFNIRENIQIKEFCK